jgi:hypothetical protein
MTHTDTKAMTITRHLAVPLTVPEKNEKQEALVKTLNDLERLEDNFVALREQHKANVTNRKLTIRELSHDFGNNFVMRPVSCEQIVDLEKNRILIKRLDTGAEVEERSMTKDEMAEARRPNNKKEATRLRMAATEKGQAEKILVIKQAEAKKESDILRGEGIAGQRKAMIEGLRESVQAFKGDYPELDFRRGGRLICCLVALACFVIGATDLVAGEIRGAIPAKGGLMLDLKNVFIRYDAINIQNKFACCDDFDLFCGERTRLLVGGQASSRPREKNSSARGSSYVVAGFKGGPFWQGNSRRHNAHLPCWRLTSVGYNYPERWLSTFLNNIRPSDKRCWSNPCSLLQARRFNIGIQNSQTALRTNLGSFRNLFSCGNELSCVNSSLYHLVKLASHNTRLIDGRCCEKKSESYDASSKHMFRMFMPSIPAWLAGVLFMLIGCTIAVLGYMYFIYGRFAVAIGLFMLALVVDLFALSFIIDGHDSGFFGLLRRSVCC